MENTVSKKRWGYVAAGTVILLFAGLIYVWSLFRAPLSAVFTDWTESQLSLVFTVSIICFCLGGFFGGKLSRNMKHRYVVLLSAAMLFVGYFVSSLLDTSNSEASIAVLTVFYGIFCGIGAGLSYNAVISAVVGWFPDKAGVASGIMLFGFGAGSLILGSVISMLIDISGIFNTFKYIAIAVAVVLAVGSIFIKTSETHRQTAAEEKGKKQFTTGQMLKTASFWLFFGWIVAGNAAGLLVINSAANIASAFGAVAILGMLVSVMNGGGRIFYGFLFDKYGRKFSMTLNCFILLAAGLLLTFGGYAESAVIVLIGMLATGISYSCSPTASSAFVHASYGSKNYAANFSVANFSLIPAAVIGPMISGSLFEASGGSYESTFIMMIVFAVIAIVFNLLLNISSKKELGV
jgi:OFA family oxalate/formate antiporter-like MFS transporter